MTWQAGMGDLEMERFGVEVFEQLQTVAGVSKI